MDIGLTKIPGLCPVCNKPNTAIILPTQSSQEFGTPCDHCLKIIMEREPAILSCRKCGRVAAMIQPGVAPNGFEFTKKATYHVPACKKCTPGYLRFDEIEEMLAYEERIKKNG